MRTFAESLRLARKRRDLTVEALARICSMSQPNISHFESGRREPSLANLRKIAVALDVTADYLLGLTNDTRRI